MIRFAAREDFMVKEIKATQAKDSLGVDKGLVAMFLKMSPEEPLRANHKAVHTILELRNAFKKRKSVKQRSEQSA